MSSRNILCERCTSHHLPQGTRKLYDANDFEPAEFQRLTLGKASQPQNDQRYILVNGRKTELDSAFYNCDTCNAEISPGGNCSAWTIWTGNEAEPDMWEYEFLQAVQV